MSQPHMTREEFADLMAQIDRICPESMQGRELSLVFAAMAFNYGLTPEAFDAIISRAREIYYSLPEHTGLKEPSK